MLAASYVGRRLAALVLEDDQLHLVVKGRRLRPAEGLVVAPYQLESEPKELAAAAEEGLGRLLLTGSRFLVTVNGRWWSLGADYPPERISNLVAVGPTDRPDIVQAIWRSVRGQVWRGSGWL
ncbi:MAG: hypothetical protein J0H43_11425, partial [Actinobacteria bacterium]|nr:hypothetical protein [Actinomycetota bacterium]